MRLIKHNAIENFQSFSSLEKQELLVQELSKSIMLFRRSFIDVLTGFQITPKSSSVFDVAKAIEEHVDNLGLVNKVVRLSFLVNRNGNHHVFQKDHENMRYRELMKDGSVFLKEHSLIIADAVSTMRQMIAEGNFAQRLADNVRAYLNMDGEQKATKPSNEFLAHVNRTNRLVWGVLIATGILIGYSIYKSGK